MKIEYFGHSCFRVTANNGTSWVSDPYTQVGYELPFGLQADIVTVSHGHFDHDYIDGVQEKRIIANTINDFSFNGVTGHAIESDHDDAKGSLRGKNLIFKVSFDGIVFCHFGDLGEHFNAALIEKIGKVDVLMLPVGGTYTIDAVQAKRYADALQPKVIIPMHYKTCDGTINIADASGFLHAFDKNAIQKISKTITLDTKDILDKSMQILYMEK